MLPLLLFVATATYLSWLPRYLGWADESYFLYEAKRLRDGEVMYRDIFQFITPLASYGMALLFWLFGTSIATARVAMAVLHGIAATVLYATCRSIGVRREWAAIVPLAYLALCQPVWPFASPHWVSTSITLTLLLAAVQPPEGRPPRATFWLGLMNGLLIGVQQPRGIWMSLGVAALIVADGGMDRRYPHPRPWRTVAAQLGWLGAGILVVMVPLLVILVLSAGVRPVYDSLVLFPLSSYRQGHFIRWGGTAQLSDSYVAATFAGLLKASPLVVAAPLLRMVWLLARGTGRAEVHALTALVVLSLCSVFSIWYFPDVIHIAFVAPLFLCCAAWAIERSFGWLPSSTLDRGLGWAVSGALAAGLLVHIAQNTIAAREQFKIPHETAFGRIDFASRWETLFVDKVRAVLNAVPSRELFSYPNVSSIYLTAGAQNPTRFQYLFARVSPPEHIREAQQVLQAHRVQYVVASPMILMGRDAMAQFLKEHYESVGIPEIVAAGELSSFWLYRRKAEPGTSP